MSLAQNALASDTGRSAYTLGPPRFRDSESHEAVSPHGTEA
jgi:hypothetical protein